MCEIGGGGVMIYSTGSICYRYNDSLPSACDFRSRQCLAKNAKESASVPAPLKMLKSTTKFKKHITIVCDRLGKGSVAGNACIDESMEGCTN